MTKAHFVKKARKDIYSRGTRIKRPELKKRYSIDKSIPFDDNDRLLVPKGDSYWWWQFAYGTKNVSRTKPNGSQLTQSEFLSRVLAMGESVQADTPDDIQELLENLKSEAEEVRDMCEESRENMPESLQDSPTGEMLQERYDAMDECYNELDSIDIDDLDLVSSMVEDFISDNYSDLVEAVAEDDLADDGSVNVDLEHTHPDNKDEHVNLDDVRSEINEYIQTDLSEWLECKVEEIKEAVSNIEV